MSEHLDSSTHHGRHAAVLAVVAFLAICFLAPVFLWWAVGKAVAKRYITQEAAFRLEFTVFAPSHWLSDRSKTYRAFLLAEEALCERVFGPI